MARSRRSGASLLELIIVIAIIMTLVGLLLPALGKVREASNRTKCLSNLRQIGFGFEMYFRTQRKYPYAGRHLSLDPDMPQLFDALGDYIGKDRRLFSCPSDTKYYSTYGSSFRYGVEFPPRPRPNDKGELKDSLLRDIELLHGRFMGMDGYNQTDARL